MSYIRVRSRNKRRVKSYRKIESLCDPISHLFSFMDTKPTANTQPNPRPTDQWPDLESMLCGNQLIPTFYENEANLVNTSTELMSEYRRQRQWFEAMKDNKRLKTSNHSLKRFCNNGYNYRYLDSNSEPFYTLLVRVLSSLKPTVDELRDNLKSFGEIKDIVIESDGYDRQLSAFVCFECSEDALDLYKSSESVVLKYNCPPIESKIQAFPKPWVCCEGIESIADIKPIDGQLVVQRVKSCKTCEEIFDVMANELLLSERDGNKRQELVHKLEEILNDSGIDCKLHIFGSTVNRLGFRDSDIDVFIEMIGENNINVRMDSQKASDLLDYMRRALNRYLNVYIRPTVRSRRCPILKLNFKHFSDSLRRTGIHCDLSLVNSLGINNSKLIAFYCGLDKRFHTLATVLRYLAKTKGFIGSNLMSSYGLSMLIVFYCQIISPPLLPTVEELMQMSTRSVRIDGIECGFCDDFDVYRSGYNKEVNKWSISLLFYKFFRFYSKFDFNSNIICPRFGRYIPKEKYDVWMSRQNVSQINGNSFRMTDYICIQDPFDFHFNVTHHMPSQLFRRLTTFFKTTADNCDQHFNGEDIKDFFPQCFVDLIDSKDKEVFELENKINEREEEMKTTEGVIDIIESEDEIEIIEQYLSEHSVGKVVLNFESKLTNEEIENKLNHVTTKALSYFRQLFKYGFQLNCCQKANAFVKLNSKSVFGKFCLKYNNISDKPLIDSQNRDLMLNSIKDITNGLDFISLQTLITNKMIERKENIFTEKQNSITFEIQLDLSLETDFEIHLNISEVKPKGSEETKGFIEFICKTFSTGLESEELLVTDDDILVLN